MMMFLRMLGVALGIVVSLVIFTVAYTTIRLYLYNPGAERPAKSIGLAMVFTSPSYWVFAIALVGGLVWLFTRHHQATP